eukprot:3963582-Prorocentrum_lima.AAC.1
MAFSAITLIVEQRVSDVLHVDTYLVGASRFKYTLYQRDIAQTFQYPIVGDGVLSLGGVTQYGHLHA